eukprot:gb/GECG01013710.1/.p1 GENE.gb/GECG01013710.1/~~gb/GECG01013710.1/.p1  ORF type:complete len:411 (+),score=48.79 gb/GECG01013710.1/:1-1233(+)
MATASTAASKKEEKRQRALEEKKQRQLAAHRKRQGRGAFALQELAIVAPHNAIDAESSPFLDELRRFQLDGSGYDRSDKQAALKYPFLENIMIYAHHYKMRVIEGSQVVRWVPSVGNGVGGSPYVFRFLRQMCTWVEGKTLTLDTEDPLLDPLVVVVWEASEFCSRLEKNGIKSVLEFLDDLRSSVDEVSEIIVLLQGVSSYLARKGREKKKSNDRNRMSEDRITEITVKLHVTRNVTVRKTANQAESAEALVSLARAASEKPYRMSPAALAVAQRTKATFDAGFLEYLCSYYSIPNPTQSSSSKPRGNKRSRPNGSTKSEDHQRLVRSDLAVWYAQLQMIPGVSTTKALNIVKHYPSFRSLMEAYGKLESDKQRQEMLQSIINPPKRHFELSRKICEFFNCDNPFTRIT